MKLKNALDRRTKLRFALNRELRYKLLDHEKIVATGEGETVDMSSGGIAFRTDADLTAGNYIELSISWPALLGDSCPMRLVVYGKVVRRSDGMVASTVEKWEFRTGSGKISLVAPVQTDQRLIRWIEYRKEVMMKAAMAPATVTASATA
jgi:PilZ domain